MELQTIQYFNSNKQNHEAIFFGILQTKNCLCKLETKKPLN